MNKALALLLLCLPRVALAAGSVSFSTQQINQTGNAYMVTINWTGDASTGSVPTTTISGLGNVQGFQITQIETVPGTPAPTAGYSITVKDVNGYDMAGGQATTLSATAAASFATTSAVPPIVGNLVFALTGNSVASAQGRVILYIFKPSVLAAANLLGRYGSSTSTGDVVGPASATDNALARYDGTTGKLIQDSAVTVDDSGNLSTPGTITSNAGASTAGFFECGQGSSNSLSSNSFMLECPSSIPTSYKWRVPSATGTGFIYNTDTAGTGALSLVGTTGSGNVVLATSPTLTTPNLGTPSAATLTNATGLPVATGISGLGTGVATALAIAKDTSGGFCTVGGGACTGGGGGSAVAPYSTTVTAQTSVSISAATHGQGTLAIPSCFDNSTPRGVVACSFTRNTSGDLVFTFNPSFTGLIQVGSGGGVSLTPYSSSVTAQTAVSISAATHGKGTTPTYQCLDNSGTPVQVFCRASINGSGDLAFSFAPAFTGTILVRY